MTRGHYELLAKCLYNVRKECRDKRWALSPENVLQIAETHIAAELYMYNRNFDEEKFFMATRYGGDY
jgi:hypothetical protein